MIIMLLISHVILQRTILKKATYKFVKKGNSNLNDNKSNTKQEFDVLPH